MYSKNVIYCRTLTLFSEVENHDITWQPRLTLPLPILEHYHNCVEYEAMPTTPHFNILIDTNLTVLNNNHQKLKFLKSWNTTMCNFNNLFMKKVAGLLLPSSARLHVPRACAKYWSKVEERADGSVLWSKLLRDYGRPQGFFIYKVNIPNTFDLTE